MDNKSKKTKKKDRKHKRSTSERKRKRSRSFKFDEKEFEDRLEEMRKQTLLSKKEKSDSPFIARKEIKLPNKGVLANIIQKQIRNNVRLDNDEVNRATDNLQKYDSGRKVIFLLI
jgi:hypothetical protein